jgi:autotransporter-associated beta strand protein
MRLVFPTSGVALLLTAILAHTSFAATPMSIVIGIDGLGSSGLRAADTPELDRLISGRFGSGYTTSLSYFAEAGGAVGTATQQPTVSGPGWSTILTGVWADQHGVTNNQFTGANYTQNPTYLEVLEEQLPDIYTAGSVNWTPIDTHILSSADDANSSLDRRAKPGNDLAVAADVAAMISGLNSSRPSAIFVHLDEVDGAGHSSGGWSQAYFNEVSDTDARVGTILRAIEDRPTFAQEDWQIVITADHGHRPNGGHGGQTILERTTPLIVTSRQAVPGVIPVASRGPTLADVVPTVLQHFATTLPAHLAGTPQGSYALGTDGGSLRDGLIQHLTFDGTVAAGLAGNGGTAHGSVSYGEGRFGQGVGVASYGDGYVTLNDDIAWQFGYTTDFTVSMWVKIDSYAGDPAFFSNKDWDSGNNPGINLATAGNNTLDFNTKGTRGTRQDLEPYGQLLPGEWQNVAFTVDRQGATTLFMDGIPVGQITQSSLGTFAGSGRFTFLNDVTGAYGAGSTTTGLTIDEFAAWNRVLTADELSFVASSAIPGLDATPPVVITVTDGLRTQAETGYALLTTAEALTKQGTGTLVLDAANPFTGPTVVQAGTVEIAVGDALAGSGITVKAEGTLAIRHGIVLASPSVTLAGGTLEMHGSPLLVGQGGIQELAVSEGTITGSPELTVADGAAVVLSTETATTLSLGSLGVVETAGGGKIDLGIGQLIVAPGGISEDDLRADILAGRNDGGWDGEAGISSSVIATQPTHAIGYVIDETAATTIGFAALGDTNLDGVVNFDDVLSFFPSYGVAGSFSWQEGDFTYDGTVNFDDILAMFPNYSSGNTVAGGLGLGGGNVAAVPEPTGLALAFTACAALVVARRKRCR